MPRATEIRDVCLCLHVQRAARLLAREFDGAFRAVGLTSGQFSLLNALDRPQPTAIGELAALLGMDRTTVTAHVKVLERDARIRPAAISGDRRERRIVLAPAGRAALAAARPIWRRTHARIEAKLGGAAGELRAALTLL